MKPSSSRVKASLARVQRLGAAFYDPKPSDAGKVYEMPDLVITEVLGMGEIVAIEYAVDRDGTRKVYRHEFTRPHKLGGDVDGRAFVLDPPCRITRRGVMG